MKILKFASRFPKLCVAFVIAVLLFVFFIDGMIHPAHARSVSGFINDFKEFLGSEKAFWLLGGTFFLFMLLDLIWGLLLLFFAPNYKRPRRRD